MSQPSFSGSGSVGPWPDDDWDPDTSLKSLVAAVEAGQYEPPPDVPPDQGLYVCVPPEQLTLEGFAQHGAADTMSPGPLLAAIVDTIADPDTAAPDTADTAAPGPDTADPDVTGLHALSDDQLIGVVSAARRLECRAAWTQLAAIAALATRRQDPARPDKPRPRRGTPIEFAADELAAELHLTWQSAANHISYAATVPQRLPRCFAALSAGLHPVHLRIIEEETQFLSDEDVAQADELLARMAGDKTFAQLRYAARRLVLKLDPASAQRRKDEAKREACVRRFREASGNAGMIARELPSAEVLASWQHVEQRAQDLRAAGVPGTLQELRVRAYLDLLQERDTRLTTPAAPGGKPSPGPDGGPSPDPDPADGPSLAALVTITVPLATVQGQSSTPGEVGSFGPLDAQDTRDVVAAAACHPRTRWCLTVLNPDGTAAAHACAPASTRAAPGPPPTSLHDPPPTSLQHLIATLRPRLTAIARVHCDHQHAQTGYQPSRKLAHLITARSAYCTAPGCNRPAARCDLDHTQAWHTGGASCECNIAPLCRHHHRCKQSDGWSLEQSEPGVLKWRTPAGRTYATAPTEYLM